MQVLHHEALQTLFPSPPVKHFGFEQCEECRCVVRMQQVTHLMRNDILNAGTGSFDQFGVQDDLPLWSTTSPSVFHLLNIERGRCNSISAKPGNDGFRIFSELEFGVFAVPGFHQLPGLVRRSAYHLEAAALVADAVDLACGYPEQKLFLQIVMGLSADILFFRTPDPEILETGLLPKNPRRPFVEFLLDDLLRRPLSGASRTTSPDGYTLIPSVRRAEKSTLYGIVSFP